MSSPTRIIPSAIPLPSLTHRAGVVGSERFRVRVQAVALPVIRVVVVIVVLAGGYLMPRLHNIDRMMNTDEADWLGNSANFYTGLVHGQPQYTFQMAHPGVTTMWAGVIAYVIALPDYPQSHPEQLGNVHEIHTELRSLGQDPLQLLVLAREVKLAFELALFLIAAWLLYRLVGRLLAAATLLLVAFDPFILGNDRFLHIDGLVTIASFAAILTVAYAARERDRQSLWALAGILSAIAWLSRFTAGMLIVVAVAVIVLPVIVALVRRRGERRSRLVLMRTSLLTYLLTAFFSTLLLWPALLANPISVIQRMLDYSIYAAETGHELPLFYDGDVVQGNLGWSFYPDVLLWRMTPFVLGGIVVLLAGLARCCRGTSGRHS